MYVHIYFFLLLDGIIKNEVMNVDDIVQYCKDNNELFVDDSFPPAARSLYYNPAMPPSEGNTIVQHWKRYSRAFKEFICWSSCLFACSHVHSS